jgi:hypothetical protein
VIAYLVETEESEAVTADRTPRIVATRIIRSSVTGLPQSAGKRFAKPLRPRNGRPQNYATPTWPPNGLRIDPSTDNCFAAALNHESEPSPRHLNACPQIEPCYIESCDCTSGRQCDGYAAVLPEHGRFSCLKGQTTQANKIASSSDRRNHAPYRVHGSPHFPSPTALSCAVLRPLKRPLRDSNVTNEADQRSRQTIPNRHVDV